MTQNKPIIIHGVDVSGCEQITYKDSLNPMCGDTGICCYGRENCCFKQLVRKTQECEELKDKIKYMKEYIKTVENTRDELEIENKFSKEQAEQKLEKIREFATALCYRAMSDGIVILQKDILKIIDEVE